MIPFGPLALHEITQLDIHFHSIAFPAETHFAKLAPFALPFLGFAAAKPVTKPQTAAPVLDIVQGLQITVARSVGSSAANEPR